ncbi:hypothetical protein L9F63_022652, partial [Diploptera punctata]
IRKYGTIFWFITTLYFENTRYIAMHLWIILLSLQLVVSTRASCDLQNLPDNCNTDLLTSEPQGLEEEATRTAQCLLNGSEQHDESLIRTFNCLLDHLHHLLPPREHSQESPERRCVICQVVQLYICQKTLKHSQCQDIFIGQINRIHQKLKHLRISQQTINPWIRRFLDVKTWNIRRFRSHLHVNNTSSNPIRPAYIYANDESNYMDRLKDKVNSFIIKVGGFPGFLVVKLLYLSCLLFNCLLFKILVCHREMRAHIILINLVVGDLLNLVFDNFVAVFFITHYYPSQLTIVTLVYFNYAIVALQIYTVILYSIQRRFSAPKPSFLARNACFFVTILLWMIAMLVPAPICLLNMSAKNGILYSFITYVLIPVISIIIFSKEKEFESNESVCCCQGCSKSSTEKICGNIVDKALQTGKWVDSTPAETSFDSEIHSGETVFCSDNERRDSLEESALHLQKSKQKFDEQASSRSQGARFQRALAIVYIMTYLPAICLYLALYFALRREEFVSYRRLCVYVYSFLNPLALYIADKALRRCFRNIVCCCCNKFKKRPDKFSLGY